MIDIYAQCQQCNAQFESNTFHQLDKCPGCGGVVILTKAPPPSPQQTGPDERAGKTHLQLTTGDVLQFGDECLGISPLWYPINSQMIGFTLGDNHDCEYRRPAPAVRAADQSEPDRAADATARFRGYACAAGTHALCINDDCRCDCHAPKPPPSPSDSEMLEKLESYYWIEIQRQPDGHVVFSGQPGKGQLRAALGDSNSGG